MAKNERTAAHAVEEGKEPAAQQEGLRGVSRLRKTMRLSMEVPVERLCDDAAQEIETLRTQK